MFEQIDDEARRPAAAEDIQVELRYTEFGTKKTKESEKKVDGFNPALNV